VSVKAWRIGGVVASVLVLVVSWFLVVSPTLDKASALEVETASQKAASQQLESRISLLKKQSEELPAQEAKLASIQQKLPSNAALPTLIRNLTTVAEAANVTVASVTPGRPAPVAQPAPPPPPPAADGEEDVNATDEEASGSDAQATGTSTASGTPAVTGPQVQSMTLNITACGTYAQLRNYLRELEQMKRVVLVSGVSIGKGSCAEGSAEDDLTATLSAYVFTMPTPDPVGATTDASTDDEAATKGDENE
jgi:Tfp pilus assembly protein PilO